MWSEAKDEKFYRPNLNDVLESIKEDNLKDTFEKDFNTTDPYEYSMMGRYRIRDEITEEVRYCTKEEATCLRENIFAELVAISEGNVFTGDESLAERVVTTVEHSIIRGDERIFYGEDGVVYRREDAKIPLHVILERDREVGYA